jgi:hypothetical protein
MYVFATIDGVANDVRDRAIDAVGAKQLPS